MSASRVRYGGVPSNVTGVSSMGSADATRRVPWLRYALFGVMIAAIWLAIGLVSNAVGASAEEIDPAASAVAPAPGVEAVSPATPPQPAAPEVDASTGPRRHRRPRLHGAGR